jgi:hypothetical protein
MDARLDLPSHEPREAATSTEPSVRNGVTIAVMAPRSRRSPRCVVIAVLLVLGAAHEVAQHLVEAVLSAPPAQPLRGEHGALRESLAAPRGVLERDHVVFAVEADGVASGSCPARTAAT